MKLTRILPKFLAKSYQEEDLRRAEIQLQYYQTMVRVLEERCTEGRDELERLRGERNWVLLFPWLESLLYWGLCQLSMLMGIFH